MLQEHELGMSCVALKDYPNATYNGFTKRMRPIDGGIAVFPEYIGYYMRMPSFRAEFQAFSTMTTRASLKNEDLLSLEIALPSYDTQKRIAEILRLYDNLIENNQKQIKLLEEVAQRVYKEWFVDFNCLNGNNFKDGKLPEGWKKDRADAFFDITIGKTPPRSEKQWFVSREHGVKWISISDMGKAGVFIFNTNEGLTEDAIDKHNIKVVPKGTILVSFKLTVGRISIATENMCTNEAIAHFYIENDCLREYAYLYLKTFEYDTLGNTSSISKAVNSKIIKGMPFVMPNDETLQAFSNVVRPYFDLIYDKQLMIMKAQEARDRLLPKLMNGEIEV